MDLEDLKESGPVELEVMSEHRGPGAVAGTVGTKSLCREDLGDYLESLDESLNSGSLCVFPVWGIP